MKMDSRISLGSHKIEQITPRSKNLPLKGGNYKNLTIKNPSFYSDDSLDQELNESSMKNSLRDSQIKSVIWADKMGLTDSNSKPSNANKPLPQAKKDMIPPVVPVTMNKQKNPQVVKNQNDQRIKEPSFHSDDTSENEDKSSMKISSAEEEEIQPFQKQPSFKPPAPVLNKQQKPIQNQKDSEKEIQIKEPSLYSNDDSEEEAQSSLKISSAGNEINTIMEEPDEPTMTVNEENSEPLLQDLHDKKQSKADLQPNKNIVPKDTTPTDQINGIKNDPVTDKLPMPKSPNPLSSPFNPAGLAPNMNAPVVSPSTAPGFTAPNLPIPLVLNNNDEKPNIKKNPEQTQNPVAPKTNPPALKPNNTPLNPIPPIIAPVIGEDKKPLNKPVPEQKNNPPTKNDLPLEISQQLSEPEKDYKFPQPGKKVQQENPVNEKPKKNDIEIPILPIPKQPVEPDINSSTFTNSDSLDDMMQQQDSEQSQKGKNKPETQNVKQSKPPLEKEPIISKLDKNTTPKLEQPKPEPTTAPSPTTAPGPKIPSDETKPLVENPPVIPPNGRQFPRLNNGANHPKQQSVKELGTQKPENNVNKQQPKEVGNMFEKPNDDALESMLKNPVSNSLKNNIKPAPKKFESPPDSIFAYQPGASKMFSPDNKARKKSEISNPLRQAGDNLMNSNLNPQNLGGSVGKTEDGLQNTSPERQRYRRKPRTDYILNKVPTFNVGNDDNEKKFLSKLGIDDDFDNAYLNMKKGNNQS